MDASNIIAILAIVLIVGGAVAYIVRAKKSGRKCIGCPDSATCGKNGCGGNCSCCSHCDSADIPTEEE